MQLPAQQIFVEIRFSEKLSVGICAHQACCFKRSLSLGSKELWRRVFRPSFPSWCCPCFNSKDYKTQRSYLPQVANRLHLLRWFLREKRYRWIFTFPECPPPSIVWKKKIKMIGHHSRLRDMMGQSYPIYACCRANHAHYSSVHVKFCSSSKHTLLKYNLEKNVRGRKCGAYRTISYKIWTLITQF